MQADRAAFVDMLQVGGSNAPTARLDIVPAPNQRALRVGTSSGADGLTVDANGGVSVASASNAAPAARLDVNAVFRHPPVGFVDDGSYGASVSSAIGNELFRAMNNLTGIGFGWVTETGCYTSSTGVYKATGQKTTLVGSTTYAGEWFEMRLPTPRVITALWYSGTNLGQYVVAGSTNGTTWASLLVGNSVANLTLVPFANSTAYTFVRIIALAAAPNAAHADGYLGMNPRYLEGPPSNRALRVGTASGGDGLVVDWNGNVGVGRNAPTSRLHVDGGMSLINGDAGAGSPPFTTNQITMGYMGSDEHRHAIRTRHRHDLNNTQNAVDFYIWQTTDGSNVASKQVLSVTSTGVGIGTTAPAAQLDLSTDTARKLSSATWSTGSDSRVKVDIQDADYSMCYSNVKSIPLRRFAWDSNAYPDVPDRHAVGWIAQEVEAVFPKAVTTTAEHGLDDFKTLNVDQLYKTMWGCLIKCIEIIESQDARIASQDSRIAALEGTPQ